MIYKNLRNYVFQFLYFFDKKAGKNTQLKNIYFPYSKHIILSYTERRKIKRKKKLNGSKLKEYATRKALRGPL